MNVLNGVEPCPHAPVFGFARVDIYPREEGVGLGKKLAQGKTVMMPCGRFMSG